MTDNRSSSLPRLLWLAIVVVVSMASTPTQPHQQAAGNTPASQSYDEMVRQLKAGVVSLDFTQLRMKYAASPEYAPEEGSDKIRPMYTALNAKNYKGALKTANAVLEQQYVNIDAHVVASLAYAGLHDQAASKLHHDIAIGLVRSILNSGSGTTVATAYKVISVEEEYALMRLMGLRPGRQSYLHEGKRSYDKMEMFNPKDNSTVTWYFDVTLSEQQMEKAFDR